MAAPPAGARGIGGRKLQRLRRLLYTAAMRLSPFGKRTVLLALDAALGPLALVGAVAVLHPAAMPGAAAGWLAPLLPLAAVLAAAASGAFGLHRVKLNAYETRAALRTAAAAAAATLTLAPVLARMAPLPELVGLVLFGLFLFLLMAGARLALLHLLLWALRLGQPRRRVIIYGAGKTGVQLAAALRNHDGILPVAFVDDAPALQGQTVGGLRVHGSARIGALIRTLRVERVLLAMPSAPQPRIAGIARRLEKAGVAVMAVPSFAQLVGEEALVDALTPVVPGRFLNRRPADGAMAPAAGAYRGRTVMVTGAGGSVGSELCRQLLALGPRRIVLFEASEVALWGIERELRERAEGSGIEIVPVLGTVADSRLARAAIAGQGVEAILHAAAYKHVPLVEANPVAGLANNVLGTRVLADAAVECGVGRFVLISTDKAVRPAGVMGASKRMAEIVVQDLARRHPGTAFSMVRFGNVLGSSGSVIPLFREQIAQGGPVTLTHEEVSRYFMTLAEAARLVLLAGSLADRPQPGTADLCVLDMGQPLRIRDLAEQMIEAAGCTLRDERNPEGDIEIVVTGLRPGEKLHEEQIAVAGLTTTSHPKILRAEAEGMGAWEVAAMLRAIRAAVAEGDAAAARALVAGHLAVVSPAAAAPSAAASSAVAPSAAARAGLAAQ